MAYLRRALIEKHFQNCSVFLENLELSLLTKIFIVKTFLSFFIVPFVEDVHYGCVVVGTILLFCCHVKAKNNITYCF